MRACIFTSMVGDSALAQENGGGEMMSTQVYITKNVDAAAEIQDILIKQYGINIH